MVTRVVLDLVEALARLPAGATATVPAADADAVTVVDGLVHRCICPSRAGSATMWTSMPRQNATRFFTFLARGMGCG